MATDVEVSPKQTIMDYLKTPPTSCSSGRKSKGIRDFFSPGSKSTSCNIVNNSISDRQNETHTLTITNSQVLSETCDEEHKREKFEQSDKVAQNSVSSKCNDSINKDHHTTNGIEQNSPANTGENLASACEDNTNMTKTSTKGKKSLSTKKKAKEKKSVQYAVEQEQDDVPKQEEVKSMPQEMDYGEFLRTYMQNWDGDSPVVNSHTDESKEHSGIQPSLHKQVENNCDQGSASKHPDTNSTEVVDSTSAIPEETKKQCQSRTKRKSNKPTNAFAVLMQPKSTKKKDTCLGEDECVILNKTEAQETSLTDVEDDFSEQRSEEVAAETTSTPSVLNFFTKTTKSTRVDGEGAGSVLVEVDIHHDPAERKITPIRKKSSSLQQQSVEKHAQTSPTMDNEIVFLGSETIEIVDDKAKKRKLAKSGSESQKGISETNTDAEKPEDKCIRTAEAFDLERKNAFLQDSTPNQSFRTTQATLHFSQGGRLAMNTAVAAKTASKTAECDSENNQDKKSKKTLKKKDSEQLSVEFSQSSERNTPKTKKKKKHSIKARKEITQLGRRKLQHKGLPQEAENKTEVKRITRLRKPAQTGAEDGTTNDTMEPSCSDSKEESGSDSKDFTPRSKSTSTVSASRSRAQELLMKARQQKQDSRQSRNKHKHPKHGSTCAAKKVEEKPTAQTAAPSPPEQGARRQSRRLAEQQKAKQEAEEQNCISVDSDSGSEDTPTPQKKNARKKVSSHVSHKNSPSGSSPKKPVGKLAPIFAKKTKKGADNASKQPAEDPELVRRRREFLLSGVPSELKRQTVCTAPCVVASEFAPFPENSHVQQQCGGEPGSCDMWRLGRPDKMTLLPKETSAEEIESTPLEWTSLQWQPVGHGDGCRYHFEPLESMVEGAEKDVKEVLVKHLQQTHPGFPFSALYDKFREQLSSDVVKQDAAPVMCTAKKKPKVDADIVIIDELEDTSAAQGDRDSQWPERLQPKCASEMIGNESCLRRLRYWLEEWKTLIQREARLSARTAAGKEDSDFDYSGEDSEGEGSQLCNTMMLVGPHGVGKTAAVYALAQQLSYKVFEVNASSSRQGRHIVAQLQEATQSHQVAQKKDGVILSPPPVIPTGASEPEHVEERKEHKKKASAVPKAFASFFKTSENVTTAKNAAQTSCPRADKKKGRESPKKNAKKGIMGAEREGPRKRRRGTDEGEMAAEAPASKKRCSYKKGRRPEDGKEGEEGNLAGCLNLTSTSLILFDEVDLVFEEDSGFLQTVQHFIHTTKIPIILTTSDPGFERHLNARFETLVFKRPPLEWVSSYLQTVCLALGMRTGQGDVTAVASLCRGDVRRALLTLQFLALSGGGRQRESQALHLRPSVQTTDCGNGQGTPTCPTSAPGLPAADKADSDEDFVCLKPRRKRSRRIRDEDDGDRGKGEVEGKQEAQDLGVEVSADKLPTVHVRLQESVLGVSGDLQDLLGKCFKEECSSRVLQQLTEECLKLKAHRQNVLEADVLHLLPLPHTARPGRWRRPSAPTSASVKRKRIRSDIYDSEASDDEDRGQKESACTNTVERKDDEQVGEESACTNTVERKDDEQVGEESACTNTVERKDDEQVGEESACTNTVERKDDEQVGEESACTNTVERKDDEQVGEESACTNTVERKDDEQVREESACTNTVERKDDEQVREESACTNTVERKDDEQVREESACTNTVERKDDEQVGEEAGHPDRVGVEPQSEKQGVEVSVEMSSENTNERKEREGESRADAKCQESTESMEVDNTSVSRDDIVNSSSEEALKVSSEQTRESRRGPEAPLEPSPKDLQGSTCSLRGSRKCTDRGLGSKLLSSLAQYYESLSAVDRAQSGPDLLSPPYLQDRCLMLPGMEDVVSTEVERSLGQCSEELATEVEVRSSRRLWQQVCGQVSCWKEESCADSLPEGCADSLPEGCADSLPEGCSIPESRSASKMVSGTYSSELRVPEPYGKVISEVMDSLPSHVSPQTVLLDYLPTLRCISQSERCRQIAKTKRRFQHHFDNIGLCLSHSTVAALSADFPGGQPGT